MGGFPALMIKPPESPVQQFAGVQQVAAGQQELQMGQLKLEEARQSQSEQKLLMEINRQNQGDLGKVIQAAQATGKVRPQTIIALQKQQVEMHTALATATEKDLANALSTGNLFAGALDQVKKVPEANRQEALKNQIASLAALGVPTENLQKQLAGLPDLSDATLNGLETALIGHNKAVEQENQRRAADAATARAAAAQSQAATSASKAPGEIAKTKLEVENFGQPTEKDKYVQAQENYRATLSRAATNANAIGKQGLESLQKQSDTYTQFRSTAESLKSSLAAAGNGNEMAAAVAPLQGTLFITTSEGVKRINETELKGVSGAGSLVERINGALGKTTGKGPLSQKLKDDMASLVDLYENAKYDSYQKQAAYTQKLHGLDPATTPILDKDGSITTVGQAGKTPVAAAEHKPGGKAAGLTEGQTGTGSDGKKYIVKGGVWVAQ